METVAAQPEANNQAHLKYRPDIDGLRAVAILPVLFYHSGFGFPGGYAGVDVFFVISGYLITKIIYDLVTERKFSFVDFYDRRIRRLFPALFAMLLAVALWSIDHLIWLDLRAFGMSLVSATIYLSNGYFYLTTGYFNEASRTMPLLHTWSLAAEEQFYIVVPFILFALVRYTARKWHVPAIAAISIVSFLLCIFLTRTDTPAAFYLLPPRAWELGLGGALAIASPRLSRTLAEGISILGLAAILYAVFAFSDATPFPGWHAAIPTVGTAAILSAGRTGASVERLLSVRPVRFIGQISYSLYLWHWPVIVALTYGRATTALTPLWCVVISFILATLSWHFVERPFRTRRLLPTWKPLFLSAAAATLVAVTAGLAVHRVNGFAHPRQLAGIPDASELGLMRPDCHHVTPRRAAAGQLCVRGAAVPPTFLFAGDSHAGALSDGLFEAARRSGVSGVQFTSQSFVPLPGRHALTRNRAASSDLTSSFLTYVRAHPELKTIIVTAFWAHEATGRSYRNTPEIDVDSQYDGSGMAYNPISFRHGLENLVRAFPDRRFVFLDDGPAGSALSLREYARFLYTGVSASPPGLPASDALAQRQSYEPILEQLAARFPNVEYRPLLKGLCGPKLCPLFGPDGKPAFRDGDHLSRFGALGLAQALQPLFSPAEPRFKVTSRQ